LNINTKNTKLVLAPVSAILLPVLMMYNNGIERMNSFKRLDILINKSLEWNDHVTTIQPVIDCIPEDVDKNEAVY
jgi:hypothetical protein